MKLTRKQELALIDLGFQQLLDGIGKRGPYKKNPVDDKGRYSHKWSAERRAKFSETMKRKWQRGDYKKMVARNKKK